MIEVAREVLQLLSEGLRSGALDSSVVLRLIEDQQGCRLVPDRLRAWDRVYEHAGRLVMVVDPQTAARFADRCLVRGVDGVELARRVDPESRSMFGEQSLNPGTPQRKAWVHEDPR